MGIDVGGTFTDVVIVAADTRALVARVKVATTHAAREGVAAGIVAGLGQALAMPGIDASRIAFIAHSTTQATNALLEGDVAAVGIVGLHGRFGLLARRQLRVPPIRLGDGAALAPDVAFARADDAEAIERAVAALLTRGAEAIVASEAFGIDRPSGERRAVAAARARGVTATSGHEVATTYGLRARTRTAVLNAAILPRMVRTARMTAEAVAQAGIGAPLMIMRSDGGVMDVAEVARRPILTMLSGPAAGIAGALMHENVTDGIFIEVGGTSSDCSVIRRGQPQMRPARVGGHRTMLRTLDVRTLGVAGGSVVRMAADARGVAALRGVGPRSAHIAGLGYACFAKPDEFVGAGVTLVAPAPGDPADCLALACRSGARFALTPTCAANVLGYVPSGDFAAAGVSGVAGARAAFALAGARFDCAPEALARAILERTAETLRVTLDELIVDYDLARGQVELVGGGGGAAALVPFAAERLGFRHRLARDAEVISPLGVALALVRDVVERTIVAATPDDVVRVRREAFERVVAAGAAPEFVEVALEIDARRNLVRATASGATAAARPERRIPVSDPERAAAAERALPAARFAFECGDFAFYVAGRGEATGACAIDARGIARLVLSRATLRVTNAAGAERELARLLEDATAFGDVGRALPEVHLAYAARVVDLGTLADVAQVVALAGEELRGLDGATSVALLAARRRA